jgi:Holliday junction resolvasome RuvABC ATP-dependent DNA helicase subunit
MVSLTKPLEIMPASTIMTEPLRHADTQYTRRIPMAQKQLLFHYDPILAPNPSLPPAPTVQECAELVNPNNPASMFHNFVGQQLAKKKMGRVLLNALQRPNHCAADVSWLLTGPSSVGKTSLARIYAKILRLPFVEIHPKSIKSLNDVFDAINEKLVERKPFLEMVESTQNNYCVPPCVVFIDEAHTLNRLFQNGLLKAIEPKDRVLITEDRKYVDTKNVCFMIATTDPADLFDAFLGRFTELALTAYTKKEVAQIVQLNFPHWGIAECALAAHFQPRLPRKAIEFAKEMEMEKAINQEKTWHEVAVQVAEENQIDMHGMPLKHLALLKFVSCRAYSKERVAIALNIREKELKSSVLPCLMSLTPDSPALVTISTGGIRLTYDGYLELKKRNMINVVPKYLEEEIAEMA